MRTFTILFFLMMVFASCTTTESDLQLEVDAGEYDRYNTVVTFQVPGTLKHTAYHLEDPRGNTIPVQIEGREAVFVLPQLNAGERIRFRMAPADDPVQSESGIGIQLFDDAAAIKAGNQQVLHYRSGAEGLEWGDLDERFKRGGYLHPVFTPNGEIVTGHYHPDRPHQVGIWSGWSRIEFEGRNPEFWYPVSERGVVNVDQLNNIWSGPVYGGIRSTHHFTDLTADEDIVILSENWDVRVYNIHSKENYPVHMFDLDAVQKNVADNPITFHEHVYGGISFRGNDLWLGEENTRLLTSEGKTRVDGAPIREVWSHVEAHQSRARWAYLSGVVDGKRPGMIILVHPENLEFPEPIFMNLREPFFAFSPAAMGDITVEPGDALHFRYRYVMLDDEPDPNFIDRLWQDYANPVSVTIQ